MLSKSVVGIALGTALLFSALAGTAAAASQVNEDQVRLCIKHVAEMERSVARQTKGDERKRIIGMLGEAKRTCVKGDIASAYVAAGKGLEQAKKVAN